MKKLLSNTLIFTISNFLIQGLQFVLLPLYSNLISTEDYGLIGTFNTSAYLIGILASLNLYGAIGKYYYECKSHEEVITLYSKITKSTAYLSSCICIGVLIVAYILFSMLDWRGYIGFVIVIVAKYITFYYSIFHSLCIVKQKAIIVAVSTVCSSLVNLIGTYICVNYFANKIIGYYVGTLISAIVGFAFFIWGSRGYLVKTSLDGVKKYIEYSVISIPSSLSYWIVNTSDKYLVIGMCGAGEAGVYNMAANFGTVHNIVVMSVNNVYVPNTFSNLKDKKKRQSQQNLMDIFFAINMWTTSGIIVLMKNVVGLLNEAYWSCYHTAIVLIVSSCLVGIMQIYNGIVSFYLPSLKKKNYVIAMGAMINIILNIFLIARYDSMGAAIATLAANLFIVIGVMILAIQNIRILTIPMKEIVISFLYIGVSFLFDSVCLKLIWSGMYSLAIVYSLYGKIKYKKEKN